MFGALYDVHVSEGCIPERDYISEMQDTSARTSKQVKIYLRRSAPRPPSHVPLLLSLPPLVRSLRVAAVADAAGMCAGPGRTF